MALNAFKFWCQKTLPLVYDDSLSYYELLCKVVDYLNNTMSDVNKMSDAFAELNENYTTLKTYVDTYFDSLDITTEIDNKLDTMAENGTLSKIFGLAKIYIPDFSTASYSQNCALVTVAGKSILFDCGAADSWAVIKSAFDTWYSDGVFTNIDYIVLSHYHYDHVENLANFLSTYPHENCQAYIPLNPSTYFTGPGASSINQHYSNTVNALSSAAVAYMEISSNTTVPITNFFTIHLWNSTVEDYTYYLNNNSVYNNYSMFALIKCGEVYGAFPGDIQRDAQIRIVGSHDLPSLAFYSIHHHAIQNDDYLPYLNKIFPQVSVIQTNHARQLVSAASSSAANFFLNNGVYSCAYSPFVGVLSNGGCEPIAGIALSDVGWAQTYCDYYIDNSYTGGLHNGTQEYPFTNLNEWQLFVHGGKTYSYRIHIRATETPYTETLWLRNFANVVAFSGYDGTPTIGAIYARNNAAVATFSNIHVNGSYSSDNIQACVHLGSGVYSFSNVTIEGVSGSEFGVATTRNASSLFDNVTFANLNRGISGSHSLSSVYIYRVTFDNVTTCFSLSYVSLFVRNVTGLSVGPATLVFTAGDGFPYQLIIGNVTATNAPALVPLAASSSIGIVSAPFYVGSVGLCLVGARKVNILSTTDYSI